MWLKNADFHQNPENMAENDIFIQNPGNVAQKS